MNKLIVIPITFILSFSAYAKDFYIDPSKGFMLNSGTAEMPWKTLQEVVSNGLIQTKTKEGVVINPNGPIKAGDTLILRTGYHGNVYIKNAYNDSVINIVAENGNLPSLSSLRIDSAKNWLFNGLTISGSFANPKQTGGALVIMGMSSYFGPVDSVQIMNCTIYTDERMESIWTSSDWNTKSSGGVNIAASSLNVVVRNNYIYNVNYGVAASGLNSLVEGNVISMFANDGIRIAANGTTVRDNVITNNINAANGNHDDGIQDYGGQNNINISGNIVYEREYGNNVLPEPLQGIGLFDGPYSNIQIQNNLVKMTAWHGIALYDATSSSIQNNYTLGFDLASKTSRARVTLSSKSTTGKNTNISILNNFAQDYVLTNYDPTNTSLINNSNLVNQDTFNTMVSSNLQRIDSIYGAIPKRKYRLIYSGTQN